MITQNSIEDQSDFQSLYNFTLRLNPSNRFQVSIHPHYPDRGSSSPDPLQEFSTHINNDASELWQAGDRPGALALTKKLSPRIKRSAGGTFCGEPWHLCQTASVVKLCIFYLWNTLAVPDLPRRKKFTATARLRILDAAGALEKAGYEPSDFYFFTGTLPGSTDLACQFFARNSRPFLDAFKGYLRKSFGLYLTFNCWEWQLREKFHLTPALHLHMIVVTKDESLGSKLPELLKEKWFQLLDYYSDKYAVDLYSKHPKLWSPAEKLEGYGAWSREQLDILAKRVNNPCETCKTIRCEKSPAAYLSKYVGKGCLADDTDFQDRFANHNLPLYYPSSWWSISDEIRDLIECYTSRVGFRNTLDECLRAYHLLEEIMEDKEFDLCELNLPVFIPSWSAESRLYRNFYCKNEAFDKCKEMMPIFNGSAAGYSSESPAGEASVVFSNAPYPHIDTPIDAIKNFFCSPRNYSKMQSLMSSLPFYYRASSVGDIDWSSKVVIFNAKKIMSEFVDYPQQSLEDMENQASLSRNQRNLQYSLLNEREKFMQHNWLDILESRISLDTISNTSFDNGN
jgi:hypothetical protein